ncbi:MAG: DUF1697 domain-containing protein [Kofleriaceae bacterium]|nr:MAG: DUF1697 domain-containing protein [Kofleriaceae bacterium]MBZ0234348.1 DUF1697 domain-containing protein [Kofleriaceae bacterium]
MNRYVVLLRGINVGGKNLIKMTALAASLAEAGFADVVTYIQSGNVLVSSKELRRPALTKKIEGVLGKRFDYRASVVIRDTKEMKRIVTRAPSGFGVEPARYHYDVLFLKEPLTAAEAMKSVKTKEGVDQAHAGAGVLYFSRLIARKSSSQLPRIVGTPIYQRMTIRNWNTTTRLLQLMTEA